ncbi:Na+/H+ antiporter subunit E [Malaciobacter canalis]|uniref:Na+/H+ antiporter subunit E n=1 Tax=Malaciobacter canalis TaxID=1912871 RepID=A0ABX4LXI1_9BACT|nr:Na+/H+ antiporter subunit E [Malaciobacter canalis]PHO11174.1 Na+/H+ antiporter subunit E [Malaciobacter canalis]QEE33259.1 multisubunit sodium:proton antiporter, MnhE subunit [Malaciobacter canalis]
MKNKNRILPHPILSVILVIIWLLLNNTIAPGHILLGAFLAVLIPWFTSSFWPERVYIRNPLTFLKFSLVVIYDIVVANLTVAKQVIGPNSNLKPTFFKLPLDITHPLGISTLASTISLTPGTVSCDLSEDRKYLIIHGLVIDDAKKTIKEIKKRYEKPLMEVFKSC